jgi:hypothetical protein
VLYQQARLHVVEHPGRVLQELGLVLLAEDVARQGPPGFLVFRLREVRVGLAREAERGVVLLLRVLATGEQVVEPIPAARRADHQGPAVGLADGGPDGVVPGVGVDPGRLVQQDATEPQPQDGIRVVGGQEQDADHAVLAPELGTHRVLAVDPDKAAADLPDRLYASLGDEVGGGDPAVVAGGLASTAVDKLGGGKQGLAEAPSTADGSETSITGIVDGELSGVGGVVKNERHAMTPSASRVSLVWAGSRGMMIWRKKRMGFFWKYFPECRVQVGLDLRVGHEVVEGLEGLDTASIGALGAASESFMAWLELRHGSSSFPNLPFQFRLSE